MKETIKTNCIVIILSIVVMISSVVLGALAISFANNRTIIAIVTSLVLASLCAIVVSFIVILKKKRANRALEQLLYNYNYSLEYEIYKRVGRAKKDSFSEKLKGRGIVIPNKYTSWKEGVIQRNVSLKDNEDFFHYLKYELRVLKTVRDCITIIATPLEIGILSVLLSDHISKGGSVLIAAVPVIEALVILMVGLIRSKNEIDYVKDVMEILCPKYCNERYNPCKSLDNSEDESIAL